METTVNKSFFGYAGEILWSNIRAFFKNSTFRYTLRRVLSGMFTLMLILAVVTALLRMLPESKLIDFNQYNKINAVNPVAAENYKMRSLFLYGRVDIYGNRIPVIVSILKNIWYILPIPKKVPIRWELDYVTVKEYWRGWVFLGRALDGDYVTAKLAEKIGISFRISILSVIFAYMIGYPLGIAMAKKPGGFVDKLGTVFIVLNYALPALVFYLLMNKILGSPNGIFGSLNFGYRYKADNPASLVPPIFSMVFLSIPGISIWVRRFMVDQLTSDYVKFARSKGLTESRIMYVHVLRNAIIPLIRNFPAVFIFAIIGSYYVEMIWLIPGTGRLLIQALQGTSPDVSLIQGLTIIYAAMGMLAFLLGDVVTVLFDPRIKLTHKGDI